MSKKISEKDHFDIETVVEYTGDTKYLEEDIYVPEELVHNKSLIRIEMNIIQYPLFSKNAKRLKNEITTYYFNQNRDTYITVKPSAGELIPGEAEERIFIALMKIMKENGMKQNFIVTPQELREASKLTANEYTKEIKKYLTRLSETSYIFKNTLYSNEMRTIVKSETNTNILSFNLIQLNEEKNAEYRKKYDDKRMKEIYEIHISEPFYQNIIRRGYLTYDSDTLLDINSGVARTLYMMLEKIRHNSLYIKESVYVLIKRIPLKYEKKHLSQTIKTLKNALEELKGKGLIKNYNFIKDSTWEKANLEIFFDEGHNILKDSRFFQDNNEMQSIYEKLQLSSTEKNIQEIAPVVRPTKEMILELMNILPAAARNLKTMEKNLNHALEKYGYEKVKQAVLYMKRQKKLKSPSAFFKKILENNWAEHVEIHSEKFLEHQNEINNRKNKSNESLNENIRKNLDGKTLDDFKKEKDFFDSLDNEEKNKIEKEAYEYYIKKCGMDGKIQKLAFETGKKPIIYEYIKNNKDISNFEIEIVDKKINKTEKNKLEIGNTKEIDNISEKNIITDLEVLNEIIEKNIEIYRVILQLSEKKIYEVKREVLKVLAIKFMNGKLKPEDVNLEISNQLK